MISFRHSMRPLAAAILLVVPAMANAVDGVTLAENGRAQVPIVVSADASDEVRGSGEQLARYLERMSGARFEVTEDSGDAGLVLGVPASFEDLPVDTEFGSGPFVRDHYRLVSTDKALYLLGATPRAVAFAAWDLLHEFGYRYYFPSENWEIVPEKTTLRIAVDRYERPDFFTRDAPRGGVRQQLRPWMQEERQQWNIRNRTESSFTLHTGHIYSAIIRRHQKEFDNHPEYLAKVDGERGGNKFCISNPGLRALIVQDAVDQIEANPQRDSVSLDPSDGGGWCQCEDCQKTGSVTDRVVLLANAAAEAINDLGYGDKYVGIYAYNYHSPPPSVTVHPKVIPSLAPAFIKGDLNFEEMLSGWSQKAEMIGIREYYGVPVWHQAMPGSGRAGRPEALARSIRDQYAADARFINAESDEAWGPHGLGYYLASRLLWDVDTSVEAVIDDFLTRCFGGAVAPMREFYEFIGSGPRHSDHMVGTMYRKLKEARQLARNPGVIQRIDDLVLYTRYVELYRKASGQEGFDRLVRFLWRSRKSIMADSVGMFWYLNRSARRSKDATWIPGEPSSRTLPPERLRTRGDEPFSEQEILAFVEEGIEQHEVLGFAPLEYSDDLVPAKDALGLADVPSFGAGFYGGSAGSKTTRGKVVNYTWVSEAPREIRLEARTGLVYNNRGAADIHLAFREARDVVEETFHPVDSAEVPNDGQWHTVRLAAEKNGLYRIVVKERMAGTRVKWPEDLPRTVLSDAGAKKQVVGRHSWYFYVPKGTRVVGAYSQAGGGAVFNADGAKVLDLDNTPTDYVSIPVAEDQAGRLWSVRSLAGRFRLQNVPPHAAPTANDLLLPREVVQKDRPR